MTTVLGRLVGGGPPGDQQGQDGKLLELADTRDEQEPGASTKQGQEDTISPAAEEAALASVITQVSRDQQAAPLPAAVQYAEQQGDEGSEVRSNWKNKFR